MTDRLPTPDPLDLIDQGRARRREVFPDLRPEEAVHMAHLTTLGHLIELYLLQQLKAQGVSPSDYRVLTALRLGVHGERATPQELNHFTRITSAGMTRTLDRLEEAGYVARVPNPDDRRSVLVELSPAGLEFAESVMRDVQAHYAQALEGLADPDAKAEIETLRRIITRLDRAIATKR